MSYRTYCAARAKGWQILAVASILLGVSACTETIDVRGHVSDPEATAALQPGTSTKEDVIRALGSPSSQSDFGQETWYYISSRKERQAFFEPKLVEQQVMQITFTSEGTVNEIFHYDKNNARKIAAVKDHTPTEGHGLGLMEQLLGNIGRFNRGGGSAGTLSGTSRRPY